MDIKFKDNSKLILASFTQVEYIESTGTQYIDTSTSFSDGFTIETTITPLLGNDYMWIAGARDDVNKNNCFGIDDNKRFTLRSGASGNTVSGTLSNIEYHVVASTIDQTLIFNGTKITGSRNTPLSDRSIKILTISNNDGHGQCFVGKIKETIISDLSGIRFHFIPVKDGNDVPCFYDTVSGTFFYNQGTGNFIAGPVVKFVGMPKNIFPKITTLYHKNTPNVDGLELLKYIYSKDNQDEIKYNHYKDSQLWNDIKTTYPDLIPYTDACHEMLSDICTCITPGPMQLASSCNDIINEGLVALEYVETTDNTFKLTLFDSFNQSRGCKYFIKFKGSTESTPFDIGVVGQDMGDEYELFGNNGTLYFDYRGRTQAGSQAPANAVLNFEVGNKYVKNRDNDTFIINTTAVTAEITGRRFNIQVKRLYEFQMYINDVLVSNLIPVQGGKIYDVVRGVIYNIPNYVDGPVIGAYPPVGGNITNFIQNCTYDDTPITIINRVRVDIGNVSGSLFELMQYAGMAGFNDNYEPQAKPRLVGTWTINDWYTTAQLAQAQAAFDGLTVVGDPNYVIDFNDLAVQVLDDTQPNYNPAVAIILQAVGYGNTMPEPPIPGQTGRWFITKTQAANLNFSIRGMFAAQTVFDLNKIVSDEGLSYNVTTFYEYRLFGATTVTVDSTKLKSVWFPSTVTTTGDYPTYNTDVKMIFDNDDFYRRYGYLGFDYDYRGYYIVGSGIDKYSDAEYLHSLWDKTSKWYSARSKVKSKYDTIIPKITVSSNTVTFTFDNNLYFDYYYTIDGTEPTINSNRYTQPFNWDGQNPIKIIIVNNNTVYFSKIHYAETTQNPSISYTNNEVVLSCENGSVIKYTIDGSIPNEDSLTYTTPIQVTNDLKLRCIAFKDGKNKSDVVSKFIITNNQKLNDIFIQSIDENLQNYNPAVCLLLARSYDIPQESICHGAGVFLTNTDAGNITTISTGYNKTDNFGINSNDLSAIYELVSFNELINTSITSIPSKTFLDCTALQSINLSNIASIGTYAFKNCSNLEVNSLPQGLTYFGYGCFNKCPKISFTDIPSGVTSLTTDDGSYAYGETGYFGNCLSVGMTFHNIKAIDTGRYWNYFCVNFNGYLHFDQDFVPTLNFPTWVFNTYSGTIYWGKGVSQADDEATLALVRANSSWSQTGKTFDTWYNYLHPTS